MQRCPHTAQVSRVVAMDDDGIDVIERVNVSCQLPYGHGGTCNFPDVFDPFTLDKGQRGYGRRLIG